MIVSMCKLAVCPNKLCHKYCGIVVCVSARSSLNYYTASHCNDKFCHKIHETVAVKLSNIMTLMKKLLIHIKVYLGFYIVSYFHNPTKKQDCLKV